MDDFIIQKNKYKKAENHPDYVVRYKEGDEWKDFGACWLKEGKGGKYFSCSKSKPKEQSGGELPI